MQKKLRIGIDGYNLAMPRGTGVATYGRSLGHTLAESGHCVEGLFGLRVGRREADREAEFVAALTRGTPRPTPLGTRIRLWARAARPRIRTTMREVPAGALLHRHLPFFSGMASSADLFAVAHRHFKLHGRFVTIEMENPPEIMHWTYPVPVRLLGSRNIYTLHDLVPLLRPETTNYVTPHYKRLVQACIDTGSVICTVSEASRQDILSTLGADPDRVRNTYQTSLLPPERSAGATAMPAITELRDVPAGGYFLFFGAIEPKKNIGRLLQAYLSMQTETRLVIVGPRAWQSESELMPLVEAQGAPDAQASQAAQRVIHLDFVPRPALLQLIRSARAVLFPSLYEGFGLPVLEAMQLGTPVLTSRISSLPEVAGQAAILVDPHDVASIADGLRRLDQDDDLRRRLSELGRQQAMFFSPARYLDRLEDMYAQALEQPAAA